MCEAIEGAKDPVTLKRTNVTDFPLEGVGLETALKNHGDWYKANPLPTCKPRDTPRVIPTRSAPELTRGQSVPDFSGTTKPAPGAATRCTT